MYESMNEAGNAIGFPTSCCTTFFLSFFLSLTTNLFESELPNRVGQANNNNGMIGAKAHKHQGYSVSDADPVGVSGAYHSRK